VAVLTLRSIYLSRATDSVGGSVGLRLDNDVMTIFMLRKANLGLPTFLREIFRFCLVNEFFMVEFGGGRKEISDVDRTLKDMKVAQFHICLYGPTYRWK
jgi:hypothetical protein